MTAISIADQEWLLSTGLVEPRVDLPRVRLHVGGPVTWYLRLVGRGAITLGDHVWYVSEERRTDRALLVHELVHVAQYRERGKAGFLVRYVLDFMRAGFRYSRTLPLEAPAYEKQAAARRLLQ